MQEGYTLVARTAEEERGRGIKEVMGAMGPRSDQVYLAFIYSQCSIYASARGVVFLW